MYLEQIMTPQRFPSSVTFSTVDFVSTDTAALASHMTSCASKRSKFFNLHAALEVVHSAVFSRMVTAAVLVGVSLLLVGIV